MQETRVPSLGWKDPLEKGMATLSSILAWRIPRTEKLGGLQSAGRKESDRTERLVLSLLPCTATTIEVDVITPLHSPISQVAKPRHQGGTGSQPWLLPRWNI